MSNVPRGALCKEILLVYLLVYHIVTIQPALVILSEAKDLPDSSVAEFTLSGAEVPSQNDISVSSYTVLFIMVICREGDTKIMRDAPFVIARLTKDEGSNSRTGE
jgi:hypothetical protein